MAQLPQISIQDLAGAGVHFGHKTSRWNAKMAPYIYGVHRGNRIHIIDLNKTLFLIQKAMGALYEVASNGGRILFVGTKFQACDVVAKEAFRCGQYHINHRWLGGMLTNWNTVSSSIKTLIQHEKTLSNEDTILTKKELGCVNKKRIALEKSLGGIREMGGIPNILFVIDTNKEHIAIKEAAKLKIPCVAILDTNSDPDGISYPIPGNDDSKKSIELYCKLAADSILGGIEANLAKSGIQLDKAGDKSGEWKQEGIDTTVRSKGKKNTMGVDRIGVNNEHKS